MRILQFSERRIAVLKCLHFSIGGQGTVIHFAQFLNWCQHPSGSEFKSGTTSFIFTWISQTILWASFVAAGLLCVLQQVQVNWNCGKGYPILCLKHSVHTVSGVSGF